MLKRTQYPPATVRQIYALAAVLCERAGEEFPRTVDEASELIERLRVESRHPRPLLEDHPLRPPMRGRRRRRISAAEESWPRGRAG
ncbi:MAG: hypothetical protein ABR583_02550 [Gaiellaceae bacterium]